MSNKLPRPAFYKWVGRPVSGSPTPYRRVPMRDHEVAEVLRRDRRPKPDGAGPRKGGEGEKRFI